jgi:hypothetical protein
MVLPIGVLQQRAYQRRRPFSLSDMHASALAPSLIVTLLASVATTSVPPDSSRISSARPRKRANAWQSLQ